MSDFDPELHELTQWLTEVSSGEWVWYAKYLSANDTYAKPNVHQGGPHLGRPLFERAFPVLLQRADLEQNPDLMLPASIDSHRTKAELRLVWYNSRRLGQSNGRDEARLTQWGGKDSPVVEAEATGALTVFAFRVRDGVDADAVRVWRCRTATEEDYLLERLPDVEPGNGRLVTPSGGSSPVLESGRCSLEDDEIPAAWRTRFPTGEELVAFAAGRQRIAGDADARLWTRRQCEEQVFYSVERFHAMPRIREGFQTVQAFVEYAGSITNRRKSRSGRSLELHARLVFEEECIPFAHAPRTELRKTPDFLFPSADAYQDGSFPPERLRMLAAKTTCKDRWRQILNEADRIPVKHLLTLQEGVSIGQFQEMHQAGVRLVVPNPLLSAYPDVVRKSVQTLEQFIADVRTSLSA